MGLLGKYLVVPATGRFADRMGQATRDPTIARQLLGLKQVWAQLKPLYQPAGLDQLPKDNPAAIRYLSGKEVVEDSVHLDGTTTVQTEQWSDSSLQSSVAAGPDGLKLSSDQFFDGSNYYLLWNDSKRLKAPE